jgi:FkbM family methyltransferase
MELFAQIIQPGDCVCDVGAHIGYVSLYFRRLAGLGRVYVFEPGQNNLPYLRANVEGTGIRLVEKAVGDHDGEVRFFLESSTGQNNSMVKDFQGLQANARIAYVAVEVREILVPLIRLDTFFAHEAVTPAFIKVDVEGAELGVLRGAAGLIARAKPAWMVEVQAEAPEILAMLSGAGYLVFAQDRRRLALADRLRGNVFALHAERHEPLIAKLGLT